VTSSRSAREAVASVSDRLAGMFAKVGGDRDAFTAREVLAMWPKVMTSLRSIREPDASARAGESFDQTAPSSSTARGPSRTDRAMVSAARLRAVARDIAPRLPIRDRPTLERHLKTHDPELIADLLTRNASGATAVAGSVGGFLVLPSTTGPALLAAIPLRVAAETLVVGMIELKLIGELHEAYGQPLAGSATHRGTTALRLWASYRGFDLGDSGGLVGTVSQLARRPTTRRAAATMTGKALGRKGIRLGAGVAGAVENRRATVLLADQVRAELRRHQIGSGTRLI
jgi:hypothetical protein